MNLKRTPAPLDYVQLREREHLRKNQSERCLVSLAMGADGGFFMSYWWRPISGIVKIEFRDYHGPALPSWVTPDLLAETRRLWTLKYQRLVSTEEALEMLQSVRRLMAVIA